MWRSNRLSRTTWFFSKTEKKKILWRITNNLHWSIQIRTIIIAAAVTIDSVVTLIAVILLPAVVSLSIKHLIAAVVVVLAD